MNFIKNLYLIKSLTSTDLKSRLIKLSVFLLFIVLTAVNFNFNFFVFTLATIYILFERSSSSVIWIAIIGINSYVRYTYLILLLLLLSLILMVKFVRDLVNKKISIKNWRIITLLSLLLLVITLMLIPIASNYSLYSQLTSTFLFTCLVFCVIYAKEINVRDFLLLFVISVLGLYILLSFTNLFTNLGFEQFKNPLPNGKMVSRYSPFGNPNFTTLILLCVFSVLYVLYRSKNLNRILYYILHTITLSFILLTISKTSVIVLAIFYIFIFIENIILAKKHKNKKYIYDILYFIASLLISILLCYKHATALLLRFIDSNSISEDITTNISNLTTGRLNIWINYIHAIFNSVSLFLFGYGAGSSNINNIPAHNTVIEYIYKYGAIVTLALIAIFIISIIPYLKKLKLYKLMPLILITATLLTIGSIHPKYIYAFAIMFLSFIIETNQKEVNNIANKIQKSTKEVGDTNENTRN